MTCTVRGKTATYLPPLIGLNANSDGYSINIEWNTNAPPYPGQEVVVATRPYGIETGFSTHPAVARDAGLVQLDGLLLSPGVTYTVWLRVETSSHYSEWQGLLVVNQAGWVVGIEEVSALEETVTFEGTEVTSPL